MSKVRVCDRCGKKIDSRHPGMNIDIRGFKYHRFQFKCEGEYMIMAYDLCPDCKNEHDAFMKGAAVLREEVTDGI